MSSVAVVGAGLIGRSWAIVFARAGWEVRITDPVPEARHAAADLIRRGLDELSIHGLLRNPGEAARLISVHTLLEEALAGVDFVQENGPEVEESKRAIFADLDRLAPPTAILASSTSAIVASRFTSDLAGRERCLVAHPVNPPHLAPVVEICGSPWTSASVLERARSIYESVGQEPVMVLREVDGFVLNRLQGALLTEAFRLVGDGIVTPQDLDKTIKHGLGLRWSFLGPFETIELNAPGGIADYCARYSGFYRRLAAEPPAPDLWDKGNVARVLAAWDGMPSSQEIAARSAWRDRRLAALQAHKLSQPDE